MAMGITDRLVSRRQPYLKWRALDALELVLMGLCGLLLFAFCGTVIFDIVTRTIGHPWLWLQEMTATFFIYAIFFGAAVATRRNDHLYLTAIAEGLRGKFRAVVEIVTRLVVLGVAISFVVFGYLNFLRGFSSFRMPSLTPIASLYAAIPICGVFVALFTIEQIANGLRNGFEHAESLEEPEHAPTIETMVSKVQRS
jgi:TRAP-type C4-dicarboxylate transport system permease small subunit